MYKCTRVVAFTTVNLLCHYRSFNLPLDISFNKQTYTIASLVASRPSKTLTEKFGIVLKSRLNFALPIVLDPSFPLV